MVIKKYVTYLHWVIMVLAQALLVVTIIATPAQGQSPVGYWTFDDGSGTKAADSSGNGHTATLVNGITWVGGKVGDAVSANAASKQYLSIPTIDLSGTQAVTVALWANRTYSTGGGHVLFEDSTNYSNSTTGFAFFPDDNACAGIRAALRGDVGFVANCYRQPSSGVWHHLAVVFDKSQTGGDEIKFYVDGILQTATQSLNAATNTNKFGDNPIYLFSRAGTTEFSSGTIAGLRIYNSALTTEQIQDLYNNPGVGSVAATPLNTSIGVAAQQQFTTAGNHTIPTTGGAATNQSTNDALTLSGSGWQQGFDFRNTAGFVTDPSGDTYVLSSTKYPTTVGGVTFGWVKTSLVQGRNRNAKLDPRLAGVNLITNGSPATFNVDLPSAGTYNISLAMGDASYEECWKQCQIQFLDGNTVLATITQGSINQGYFYDAKGNKWSAAAWPASNVSQQVTLTGTRLTVVVGTSKASGDFTPIAFLGVAQVSGSPNFAISASPASLSVAQGNQGTSAITTTISNGFNSSISLSASGTPSGTTVSFNPSTIAAPGSGNSTMTIAVGASTPPGTYPITVTGNGGGIQQTATVTLTVTAAPNFTISASPASLSVVQGNQGTSTITTAVSGGFNSSISLAASGAPSGTTVSFNPSTIAAPGSGNSTMTITVGASTPTGSYPITVTGNGGGVQQNATVTLTVTAASNYTLSASPASLSVVQGNQGTSTITTAISGGFNSAISLSASGMPSGTTVSFNPNPIPAPGSGNSTMTITVGASTPTGTYPLTVTGNGGGIQRTATITLTVTAAPSFTISASPVSLSVAQGNQGTSTITTAGINGFNSAITLSASGMPSGTTITFNPNPIPSPGSGNSTMTITVGASTPTGTYPITVTGNGGGIQQNTTVTLTVTGSSITLDGKIHGVQDNGLSASTTATVSIGTPTAGDLITCEVTFGAGTLVSVADNQNGTYAAAIPAHYNSTMTQWWGIYYKENVSGSPTSVTLTTSQASSYSAISCQAWKGAATSSSLDSAFGQLQDAVNTPNPTTGTNNTPAVNGELVIAAVGLHTPGTPTSGTNYALIDGAAVTQWWPEYWVQTTATATAGNYTWPSDNFTDMMAAFKPVIAGGNFTISASPASLSIGQGNQGTSTITTTISGGFNASISLSASGVPSGATVSFNPNPVPAPGSGNSTMTITVGASTPTGTYPITLTGNGGGIQQSATVTLTVTAQADFTISASPSSLSVVQGNQGTSTITTTISNGFNSAISLSASGVPSGTTVSFNPQTISAPGSGNSTMTITVGANTSMGTYPITVTGNGGGIQRTVLVTLTVTAQVALSWTASSSPGIAGYNAYRSPNANGPYTKLNASLISTTSYNDQSVQSGNTYYYVTTAVDSQGEESAYSNQATATIQ